MPLEAELTFSTDLYVRSAIDASAEAFAALADVTVDAPEGAAAIVVRFANVREDVEDAIADEFCNHALAGTIEHRRLAEV
ncbi:MAG: HxsD-like protein [Polyangiales bacterium]|nr:hypothetical protein [Sandaracinaceae bacterium]